MEGFARNSRSRFSQKALNGLVCENFKETSGGNLGKTFAKSFKDKKGKSLFLQNNNIRGYLTAHCATLQDGACEDADT